MFTFACADARKMPCVSPLISPPFDVTVMVPEAPAAFDVRDQIP